VSTIPHDDRPIEKARSIHLDGDYVLHIQGKDGEPDIAEPLGLFHHRWLAKMLTIRLAEREDALPPEDRF
jgi:hypothetical protein